MPDGGRLILEARREAGKAVLLSVEDTGEGIPEELRPRLFRPLTTTKSRGQGMDLAVCKRIVEAHNGSRPACPNSPMCPDRALHALSERALLYFLYLIGDSLESSTLVEAHINILACA